MSAYSFYHNTVDKQLSALAEGDALFKSELITIYTQYMDEIQREFARLVHHKNQEELALLHHKHKTTCHVLALQELTEAFVQARNMLASDDPDHNVLEALIHRVNTICATMLSQLKAI